MLNKISAYAKFESLQDNLHRHVEYLSVKIGERHLWKEGSLNRAADYIEASFRDSGYHIVRQTFFAYGQIVSNLIVEVPGSKDEIVVIGAHYDTVPGSPGADDNASAVAGMLELARLYNSEKPDKHLIFVAFVNEESPCFGSGKMGSMVYAKSLKESNAPVEIMISLEMIGYFNKNEVQKYPLPGMKLIYPKKADYLAVVGNFQSARYVSMIKREIRKNSNIKVRSLIAPTHFGDINRSDNYAFWNYGFKAVMLTDTANFRNKNYHQETDTIDSLNFEAMGEVVKGLYGTIMNI
jgi:Zn-dependent M28 family amino/carboxypeptidase